MNDILMRAALRLFARAFALTAAVGLVCASSASAAFNAQLQGQDSTSTNWVGGPLNGWEELDYIPCRVAFSGGPSSNQVINVTFEHLRSGVPAIQDLYSFTNSANVIIASAPVLNSPVGVDIWDYTFTIHITNNASGEVRFLARLSSGAHNAPGSSISLGGTPSLGNLGIAKPTAQPGNPDLSLTKAGPTNANPGQVIKYVVRYSALSTADNAVDVQVSDQLPGLVIFGQCTGGCSNLASTVAWDLGNLNAGARGRLVYSVTVSNSATAGQSFTNSALIACPQNETTLTNNSGAIHTIVVGPCVPPSIADPPQSTTNCANSSVTLDVIANGSGTLLYQWLKASSPITAATNDTYTIASLSTNDAGSYNVIVSNSCGSVTSAVAVLAVTAAPTCSISGSSSVCPFTSNLAYSVSTSASSPTYSWSVTVGSSRVDLQACKLEYSIVSPK